jgi:adenylate kinase
MRLILLGPPGSGKGTQGDLLVARYGVPRISTGDMLRTAVAANSELGRKAKKYMDAGNLVPDEAVIGIVKVRLSLPDAEQGFLLDGFPRTVAQAEALGAALKEIGAGLDAVVLIDVRREELIRRLSGRRICPECQAAYHIDTNPPKREGVCDRDGAKLIQRADDSKAVIAERLRIYERRTRPLIEYYKQRGTLVAVDGAGSVQEIFDRIIRTL